MNDLVLLTAMAFLLNFTWESAHISLFFFDERLNNTLGIFISSLADTIAFMALFLVLEQLPVSQWITLPIFSLVLVIAAEKLALKYKIWGYKTQMPIVPILNVSGSAVAHYVIVMPLLLFFATQLLSL